jgi:hypothetical protein
MTGRGFIPFRLQRFYQNVTVEGLGQTHKTDTTVKSGAPACSFDWRCAPHRVPDAAVVNRAAGPLC